MDRAKDFRARAGSGFAPSGSGRVGPRPNYKIKFRAGSGFTFSGSGRVGLSRNYEVKALKFLSGCMDKWDEAYDTNFPSELDALELLDK